MIKAVIFDFDGLIIDTEKAWYEAFYDIFNDYHLELSLETFAHYIGTHENHLYHYLMKQVGEHLTLKELQQKAYSLHQQKMKTMPLRQGVSDYITRAKELGLKVGMASSSSKAWVDQHLKPFAIYNAFEIMITRDDVTHVKPDPELFIKAMSSLHVSPNETLVFEDSLNGVKAAEQAGTNCIIVPNEVTYCLPFDQKHMKLKSMNEMSFDDVLDKIDDNNKKTFA